MDKKNINQYLFETASEVYPLTSPKNLVKKLGFLVQAFRNKNTISDFHARLNALTVPIRTEMLGTIIWPYIHNEWDLANKLDTIATHYEILMPQHPNLSQMRAEQHVKICDFSNISPGISVVIDYAQWFTREGELVINIFQDDLRVASMAFSLSRIEQDIVAYVGAVQGIHGGVSAEKSLEIYKALTKDFSGLRPRSLLLEVLKVFSKKLGATQLLGVSEQNRHHRHKYFGNDENTKFKNNYNPFWEEHGGQLVDALGFYDVPLNPAIRDLSEIAAKKRGQYRRRYEFIESLENLVGLN